MSKWTVAAIALAIASSGCLTAGQDARYDACEYLRGQNFPENAAESHHAICLYDPTATALPEYEDPPPYEKAFLAGWDDCWARLYDKRWEELDAQTPCTQVDEAP